MTATQIYNIVIPKSKKEYRTCYRKQKKMGVALKGACFRLYNHCGWCPYNFKKYGRHSIKYRLFRWWWMWKHRNWMNTRQKRKAFEKAWREEWKRSR